MKKYFTILFLFFATLLFAENATYISTFQSIGIYWSPEGGADSLLVNVKYREEGSDTWKDGYSMRYMPVGGTTNDISTYRGSLVNLTPNTSYEIILTLEGANESDTLTAKTWTEDFPIAKTIVVGDTSGQFYVMESGTKDGYILYDGTGSTSDVQNNYDYNIYIDASYVIIRGFKLVGAKKNSIVIKGGSDIIIENCDMSNWGEEESDHRGFGVNYQAAVFSLNTSIRRIVVQRCVIHDPRWDSSNWSENRKELFPDDPYHPRGPQAIAFRNSKGNHVFRYNEIWSDYEHMYNDIIGYGSNGSYEGSPNADTDIYGNYLSNCWDDGIESEGANRNVRIWGNYIENILIPVANAVTSIGPLYIWKNTSGRSYTPPGSQATGTYGAFIKMGCTRGNENLMTGMTYLFNNTITQPLEDGEIAGTGGIGAHYGSDRLIKHCVTRNNVLHVRKYDHSIAIRDENIDYDYDYDLCNKAYPEGQEVHGVDGVPVYVDGAEFNYKTMTANFFLTETSPGYDAGEVLPNFMDDYEGAGPDMGAFEAGKEPLQYGINAYLKGEPTRYVLRARTTLPIHGKVTPGNGAYTVNSELTVTALPDSGYIFDRWEGDLSGKENPTTINMTSNKVVYAYFIKDTTTAIGEENISASVPKSYSLSQNYPNPFNPKTVINYGIAKRGLVTVSIYNMLGQQVAALVNEVKEAGKYQVAFNASDLPSGVYIYSIKSGDFVAHKKMILLK